MCLDLMTAKCNGLTTVHPYAFIVCVNKTDQFHLWMFVISLLVVFSCSVDVDEGLSTRTENCSRWD